jgi:hypothetical protein
MYREKINGKPKVLAGRIVEQEIKTLDDAAVAQTKWKLRAPEFNYEITGVSGDYRIIERDKESSQYL